MSKKRQPIVALDPVALSQLKEIEAAQDDPEQAKALEKKEQGALQLILKSLNTVQQAQAERMAFEIDPTPEYQTYAGLYRNKSNLTPDHVIKKVLGASGDDLVAQIVQARSNHISSFGRPRMSRFSVGYEFDPIPGVDLPEDEEAQKQLRDRIERAKKFIWNCGKGPAHGEYFQPNFSQFLKMITRDAVGGGRSAVELLYAKNPQTGEDEFYGFRPADALTMYHVVPTKEEDQSIRQQAISLLERLRNVKISADRWTEDKYKWVQVINGIPRQAFTEKEMVIYNFYPTTNIEFNGYPLTPIDQCLNAIVTHINITIHNKLYFQNGRAARGMLVFKTNDIDEKAVQTVRMQFAQSINSAQSSWRMPVFGIGPEDDLTWHSIDVSGRDAEFQYLLDNARDEQPKLIRI